MKKTETAGQLPQELPAGHKGMPAKSPQPQDSQLDKQKTEKDTSVEMSLRLPHERDQSTAMTDAGTDPIIEQAYKDAKHGLKDTGKQPEMNEVYKRQK